MQRIVTLTVALLLITVATSDVMAQRRGAASPFKVGQQVEVERFGQWEKGQVERILPTGSVQVRLADSGHPRIVRPDRVRPLSGAGGSTDAPSQGGGFGGGGFGGGGGLNMDDPEPAQADSMRTWTDSSGKFQVQARFVRREGDQVTIEQEGGKQTTLPLDRLSAADQAYVNSLGSSDPAIGAPFGRSPGDSGISSTEFDAKTAKQIDLSQAKTVPVTPDGVAAIDSLTKKPISMGSGRGKRAPSAFPPQMQSVVIHRPSARAFVTWGGQWTGPMGGASDGQVVCFDLKKGKTVGNLTLSAGMRAVDLSPSAKRMLVRGPIVDNKVYVWDLEGGAKMAAAWRPGSSDFGGLDMVAFLDDRHVVTVADQGKLTVWDIEEKKAVYSIATFPFTVPAVSPGRKQIALATKEGIFLVDARDGTPLATLPGEPGTFMRLCFRDDGRQLAGVSHTRVQIWDLEKAERTRDIYPVTPLGPGPSLWLSPNYILVNGTDLVDLERRVVLWKYQWHGLSSAGASYGGLYWTMLAGFMGGQPALVAIKLPHPEAEQIAQALLPEKILALKPGSAVSVRVTAAVSGEDQQVIRDALVKRLTDNRIRVVDGADLVLSAETAQGATEEVAYHGMGGGTAQVTQQISRLKITEKGKELWKVTQVKGAPMFVSHKQDESLESAIARNNKPTTAFFVNTPLPQYLARAGENGVYGESSISADGIKPVQKK